MEKVNSGKKTESNNRIKIFENLQNLSIYSFNWLRIFALIRDFLKKLGEKEEEEAKNKILELFEFVAIKKQD